jgi:S-adenosylmethionine-diacylgycerolhomoserine-N-methlytransferase
MNSLRSDLAVLYHLALRPIRGSSHAERMENFYRGQAAHYDQFRKRLLPGRKELFQSLRAPDRGVWVDLGGGTGANFEELGDRIHALGKAYVVDLSHSLLTVARQRAEHHGWRNVEPVCADATTFRPPEGKADVVTFSYALTMIPDWFAAVENAESMLKEGGTIGVVDFYVSRPFPIHGMARHSKITRLFWPLWFSLDGVFLSADHLPFLRHRFETILLTEGRSKVPYLPWGRVPFYTFVGKKPVSNPSRIDR